jgi:hypothetical protein
MPILLREPKGHRRRLGDGMGAPSGQQHDGLQAIAAGIQEVAAAFRDIAAAYREHGALQSKLLEHMISLSQAGGGGEQGTARARSEAGATGGGPP